MKKVFFLLCALNVFSATQTSTSRLSTLAPKLRSAYNAVRTNIGRRFSPSECSYSNPLITNAERQLKNIGEQKEILKSSIRNLNTPRYNPYSGPYTESYIGKLNQLELQLAKAKKDGSMSEQLELAKDIAELRTSEVLKQLEHMKLLKNESLQRESLLNEFNRLTNAEMYTKHDIQRERAFLEQKKQLDTETKFLNSLFFTVLGAYGLSVAARLSISSGKKEDKPETIDKK